MRFAVLSLAAALALAGGLALAGQTEDLIRDLGSEDFKTREAATAALSEKGSDAVPALEKAAQDKDPEVRWRAEKALQAVRSRGGKAGTAKPRDVAPAPVPPITPAPPEIGDAIEKARRRLRGIEDEMGRMRPELKDLLRGFGKNDLFGKDLDKVLEEMERRFRDIDHPDQSPVLKDFWTFRYKDGRWEIIRGDDPLHSKVGVRTQPVPPVLRAQLKLDPAAADGVVIEEVMGGIAADAGLRQWDLVVSIDGQPVQSDRQLESLVTPGAHRIAIFRGGERSELTVTTKASPDTPPAPETAPQRPPKPETPAPPQKEGELRKF